MSFKNLMIGLLIGLFSGGAFAESRWVKVNSSFDGFTIYLDMNSISNVSEYPYQDNKKFWTKNVVDEDMVKDGFAVGDYFMFLNWVNCKGKTMGRKSIFINKKLKNGLWDSDSSTTQYVEMTDVIPDSIGEDLVTIVCLNN